MVEKTELKVSMEPERLDALRYFLSAKEKSTPEKELQRALDQLYEKCVPEEMREYLDSRCKPSASRPRPRRAAKAVRDTQVQSGSSRLDIPAGNAMGGRHDEEV